MNSGCIQKSFHIKEVCFYPGQLPGSILPKKIQRCITRKQKYSLFKERKLSYTKINSFEKLNVTLAKNIELCNSFIDSSAFKKSVDKPLEDDDEFEGLNNEADDLFYQEEKKHALEFDESYHIPLDELEEFADSLPEQVHELSNQFPVLPTPVYDASLIPHVFYYYYLFLHQYLQTVHT